MKRFLQRLPGRLIRLCALIGLTGVVLAYLSTQVTPVYFPFFAFFGLTYFVWFTISVIGLVYSLARKRWVMVGLVALTFIFTWDLVGRTFSLSTSEEFEEHSNELSIMSYNVRLFDLYNWTEGVETRNTIFDFLEENPSDVICFQEFYRTDRTGVFETRDTLVQFLDNVYVHEKLAYEPRAKQYFGIATFSKYKIIGKGEVDFQSEGHNYCIYTDIKKGDDTLRIYNTHLASIRFQHEDYEAIDQGPKAEDAKRLAERMKIAYRKRAEQADHVSSHMRTSPYPTIIAGDFNDTPVSYVYEQISRDMTDAFHVGDQFIGTTHLGKYPFFRIDYLMHSPELNTKEFRTIDVRYSDHRPIRGVISF
ncbi:MAG: endonuclease/exonuclease/phosphatase family protein [Flavobacteriales bacterium]|nr:endonuclease/exonuclease/phosphatase family protein [Flavobacteriales bacterium]